MEPFHLRTWTLARPKITSLAVGSRGGAIRAVTDTAFHATRHDSVIKEMTARDSHETKGLRRRTGLAVGCLRKVRSTRFARSLADLTIPHSLDIAAQKGRP